MSVSFFPSLYTNAENSLLLEDLFFDEVWLGIPEQLFQEACENSYMCPVSFKLFALRGLLVYSGNFLFRMTFNT